MCTQHKEYTRNYILQVIAIVADITIRATISLREPIRLTTRGYASLRTNSRHFSLRVMPTRKNKGRLTAAFFWYHDAQELVEGVVEADAADMVAQPHAGVEARAAQERVRSKIKVEVFEFH